MRRVDRRTFLLGAAGAATAGALGVGAASPAHAAPSAQSLTVVESGVVDHRLRWYRFQTDQIGWNPAVNILLPDGYENSGKRYPVLYLLHGGAQDFRWWHLEGDVVNSTAGHELIVVMPDGGTAGWYCNPVASATGPRNWETFHIGQLLPWVEANFRTFPEYDGRAVAGFSMGGFGALKYAAKYYGHFCAVTSLSGPASLRRDGGAVVHWMQTSAAVDLGLPGGLYGIPWDEARVSADNPVERIPSYQNKRVAFYSGTDPNDIQEARVLAGQREFAGLLRDAGIAFHQVEHPGGHGADVQLHLREEIPAIVGRLKRAG